MSRWLMIVLFLAALLIDGIIFPGLFGFKEGFLAIIFIVITLLYYGPGFKGLILGVLFSGLTEFYWGLKMGMLILPLFASAGTLFLLNSFFNTRSRIFLVISGIIAFIIFWETSVLVSKIL